MRGYQERPMGASVSSPHRLMMNTMLNTADPTMVPGSWKNKTNDSIKNKTHRFILDPKDQRIFLTIFPDAIY